MKAVIDLYQLSALLDDPNLIVLDASYPPVGGQKPRHEGLYIKGSRRFDIDYFSDQKSDLPHMLAPTSEFEAKAQALGISKESQIVIYDNIGVYSSPRAYWMFKIMGQEKVSVLNGGLPKWISEGYPVEELYSTEFAKGNFKASFDPMLVKSMQQVRENMEGKSFQLIDARSKGRFDGTAPEPRAHLQSGHIEGSLNIPFQEVLEDGCFRTSDELKQLFQEIPAETALTFSCGSGLTACIVMLAAEQALENKVSIYDGSWTEWASVEIG